MPGKTLHVITVLRGGGGGITGREVKLTFDYSILPLLSLTVRGMK